MSHIEIKNKSYQVKGMSVTKSTVRKLLSVSIGYELDNGKIDTMTIEFTNEDMDKFERIMQLQKQP